MRLTLCSYLYYMNGFSFPGVSTSLSNWRSLLELCKVMWPKFFQTLFPKSSTLNGNFKQKSSSVSTRIKLHSNNVHNISHYTTFPIK